MGGSSHPWAQGAAGGSGSIVPVPVPRRTGFPGAGHGGTGLMGATVASGMWGQANGERVGSRVGRSTWGRVPRFSQLVPCPSWDLHRSRLPFHDWFFSLQRADTEQAVCTSAGTPAPGFNHSAPAKKGGTGALCCLPAFPTAAASTSAQVGSSHPPRSLWLRVPRPRAQTQPLLQPGGKPELLARDWRADHQFMTLSREKKFACI